MLRGKKSLAETHPEVAKEWHPTLNGDLTASEVTPGSNKKVWWKCEKGDDHEYDMLLSDRKRGYKCPICRGLRVVNSTSLEYTNPELLNDWNYEKNTIKPSEITVNSNKRVWWKCSKEVDHVWKVDPNSRYTQKSGCPFCESRKVAKSNSLMTTHPKESKQWHPTKNGTLKPNQVLWASGGKIWRLCTTGQEFDAKINHRTTPLSKSGCPFKAITRQSPK